MTFHFVEIRVRDWLSSLAWYSGVLGLEVTMRDEVNRFALLAGRVALKEGDPTPGGVLLAFEVADLRDFVGDVKVSTEGYRRVRLNDPDGYDVVVFEFTETSRPED